MIVADPVWGPTSAGARRRTKPASIVAWHWTGGKTSASCIATLRKRGLSIHYTIDHDGAIREHADPMRVVTQHVGRVAMKGGALSINDVSIGIEIAHKGFAPSFPGERWKREEYETTIHGVKRRLLRFTPEQRAAARALARYLSDLTGIPLELPRDASGAVIRTVLPLDMMRTFRGHAGHFHFERRKTDPGVELLEELVAA